MKLVKQHFLLMIFLALYFLLISYKLISQPTPFFDWDESINVQVAKEMIEKKSLVPLWQGKVWLDKPPLPFLFFGIIMKLTPFITPEISLRIISLLLSIISLIFIYSLFYKATKDKLIPLLTVIITSFTPIFIQRSQILNLDVFLLIGWLGYLLFVQNFWLSLFFFAIAVLTKSLIGFYPAVIFLIYNLIIWWVLRRMVSVSAQRFFQPVAGREHSREGIRNRIRQIIIHILILSIWYLLMLLFFGKDFWQQHIIETHFRRVTASIESHFGQRTYYLDLMFEQLKWLFGLSVIGFSVIVLRFFNRKLTTEQLLYLLFLFPWFIFLNLTKTKIFWYLYPAIPQFAFLSVYPLSLLYGHSGKRVQRAHPESLFRFWSRFAPQNDIRKTIYYLLFFIVILYIFQQNFLKTNFFTTFYSKPEDHYRLALYAKDKCDELNVLVGKETREANKTLENLGLTITSTTQWGDHPSIVYYFGKKVSFIYLKDINLLSRNGCLAMRKDDLALKIENKGFQQLKDFNSYYLFKR